MEALDYLNQGRIRLAAEKACHVDLLLMITSVPFPDAMFGDSPSYSSPVIEVYICGKVLFQAIA